MAGLRVFSFAKGIDYVLQKIAISDDVRITLEEDAHLISNAFTNSIRQIDSNFQSIKLGISYFEGNKIELHDEFNMYTKIKLNCNLKPISLRRGSDLVYLSASDGASQLVSHFGDDGYFVDRRKIQGWIHDCITRIIPELQSISYSQGRTYSIEYTTKNHGEELHTLLATQKQNPQLQITFDLLPIFEFGVKEWPGGTHQSTNDGGKWVVVPCQHQSKQDGQDYRSFIQCAPRWKRLKRNEKDNLKNSLRLMKTIQDAKYAHGIDTDILKSIYHAEVETGIINLKQEPGRILLAMLINLLKVLQDDSLHFFRTPSDKLLDKLSDFYRDQYSGFISETITKLKLRRDADSFSKADIYDIFGIN